jgi:hypothetical protein
MTDTYKTGKDLTKEAPRSAYVEIGGFAILGRTIDKCRAKLWGNIGEYHFDCPLDNQLFSFKGIKGDDFKAFVEEGHSDEEIGRWVKEHGTPKTDEEIAEWSLARHSDYSYSDVSKSGADKVAWFVGECEKLGLEPETTTLYDYLDADDKASYHIANQED